VPPCVGPRTSAAGRNELSHPRPWRRGAQNPAPEPLTQARAPAHITMSRPGWLSHERRARTGLIGSYASPGANRLRDPAGPSSEASRTQCQLRSRAALREISALNWSFPISSE
jgi:hypothetical protein